MKNKTKEEAYLEMLKPAETITFKVQNCVDNLSAIKESRGDGFYIRYLWNSPNQDKLSLNFSCCKAHFCFVACNKVRKRKTGKYANQNPVLVEHESI